MKTINDNNPTLTAPGFLPQHAQHLAQWLSNRMKAAKEDKEAKGSDWAYLPVMNDFINFLNSDENVKGAVINMISEGKEVHAKYEPQDPYYIDSLDDLLTIMNFQIILAPIFAPNVPHTAFPFSGIFVYMMFTNAGSAVFSYPPFNAALKNVLDFWCNYLDSPASLDVVVTTPGGWLSPESVVKNDLDIFVTEEQKIADPIHWGFKSFNDFFHRNVIPKYRPIAGVGDRSVVVSANDGTVNRLAHNLKESTIINIKSQPYSLSNMLDGSPYMHRFIGGDVLQSFLSGNNYHRWHAPISGILREMRVIPAYMFSELLAEGFDSSAGTLSQEYEANVNTRAIVIIESPSPGIGAVCVMPIGITEISSIKFNSKFLRPDGTPNIGMHVNKGDILGRFSYGGSSLCLIFQPGAIVDFDVQNPVNPSDGQPIKVNAKIATANDALVFKNKRDISNSFKALLTSNKSLSELLVQSLVAARNNASGESPTKLNPFLFQALDWPVTTAEYDAFLMKFWVWKPQQTDNEAWKNPSTGNAQEVYDRLCHFYYLIDQPVGEGGATVVQSIPEFADFLVAYANQWGTFLNTPESFNDEILTSFETLSPKFRVQDSMVNGKPNNPSGWLTWNQFFARELNPGLRPIASPDDNKVIVSPADCTYRNHFAIEEDSSIEEIIIKKTGKHANINTLLKGSKYADSFGGGTFVHYFLGPYSYHRFHTPVAGKIEECYAIQGYTYLEVNLKDGQFDAPDNAENGYEFAQARGVITVDTTNSPYGDVGVVAIIPVGMCQVSSVNMIATPGATVGKGEEFGYFLFGGSDIIMLFQKGVDPKIATNDAYRHYGTDISLTDPNED